MEVTLASDTSVSCGLAVTERPVAPPATEFSAGSDALRSAALLCRQTQTTAWAVSDGQS